MPGTVETGAVRAPQGRCRKRTIARVGPLAAVAALAFVLAPRGAHATGTLNCSIDDGRVAFEAQTAFSHGLGASFNNFQAVLELKGKDVPPGLARIELDKDGLPHHWFRGRDLKLLVYYEPAEAPHRSVELVIEARGSGEDNEAFAGRYVLVVTSVGSDGEARTRTLKGRATCSAG